ncbi:hypothetical protein HRR83_007224 [Exophiala dermatitidis]|uniref:Uncharacterized protein n=1 Tax=Exophiala dermatitidis TaxID=5970 RepID=A0AAN6ET52_EXODE|nr:hypothetical protein HRR75_006067 [Exophiala dermatitidis]KAJ4511183.1 hypothetical protein HRR73_006516 [Exophiala dermatitidis]KAJ4511882.1 hypothetical protein HRR74_006616 [Exophiala dermatitidis]KAJ4534740.1 hypothetical protein HRR76_006652 [Exophiala dermatitidis]KAJ4545724.1 hypothetical protein HRR78_005998 [Exophiala dermatitidis]
MFAQPAPGANIGPQTATGVVDLHGVQWEFSVFHPETFHDYATWFTSLPDPAEATDIVFQLDSPHSYSRLMRTHDTPIYSDTDRSFDTHNYTRYTRSTSANACSHIRHILTAFFRSHDYQLPLLVETSTVDVSALITLLSALTQLDVPNELFAGPDIDKNKSQSLLSHPPSSELR